MARPDEFREALESGDVDLCRRVHGEVFPHLPAPKTRDEAEKTMHLARTAVDSVAFRHRAWSHSWLTERGLPSLLPDRLRPSAERLYPRKVEAVGISVNLRSPFMRPAKPLIVKRMADVVEEMFAAGDREPGPMKARMLEAKDDEMRRLFGKGLPA